MLGGIRGDFKKNHQQVFVLYLGCLVEAIERFSGRGGGRQKKTKRRKEKGNQGGKGRGAYSRRKDRKEKAGVH